MQLDSFNVEESKELTVLHEIDIDESIFLDIRSRIINAMDSLGIKLEGKSIYYQRFANKTSVLAIKLGKGEDSDTNNFMFNGCDATYFDGHNSCDVYLHANKKVGQEAMAMANMVSRDIVDFFDTLERELAVKGLNNSELLLRIPLVIEDKKEKASKDNSVIKLIKTIFKK